MSPLSRHKFQKQNVPQYANYITLFTPGAAFELISGVAALRSRVALSLRRANGTLHFETGARCTHITPLRPVAASSHHLNGEKSRSAAGDRQAAVLQ